MKPTVFTILAALGLALAAHASAQQPAQAPPPPSLVAESQQQLRAGHLDQALAAATQAVSAQPDSAPAHLQLGFVLDLMGQYKQARDHFSTAQAKAATEEDRTRAARALAVSHGFERDCAGARDAEAPVFDRAVSRGAFTDAGEIANELGRLCLEAGDIDTGETWYRKGYDAASRIAEAPDDVRDLWSFRWEHAQARIAARRGDRAGAATHVAAAKAALDRGHIAQQAPFFPYLTGYVAFYEGDYAKAAADLAAASQTDPFVLSLQAQALEKTGEAARARELYRKVLASTAHNPANAAARPLAQERLRAQ